MPFINIWIHFVWATKRRLPLLTSNMRQIVFDHIKSNALEKGIHLSRVGGYEDHVHCTVSLSSDQTISKIMQLIKGESSFWINKNNLCSDKFEWQDDYFAVSVSPSQLKAVHDYIDNQEIHHKKKTFEEEYQDFIKKEEIDKGAKAPGETINEYSPRSKDRGK